jgi:hypothetical protein
VKTLLSKDNNDKINLNIESDNYFDPEVDERLLPYNKANVEISNFNPSSLKDIEKRIYRYDKLIDALRSKAFSSYLKHGDYREIQNENNLIESTKVKGVDNLFSQRKSSKEGNKTAEETTVLPIKALLSKTDVILDNPILIRYFGHLMSDLYDNYFKMLVKSCNHLMLT